MNRQRPEDERPSDDFFDYWPDNIFIPRRLLKYLPKPPWIRDLTFVLLSAGIFILLGIWIGWFSEALGAAIAALPIVLVCNWGVSLNRAIFDQIRAQNRYREQTNERQTK